MQPPPRYGMLPEDVYRLTGVAEPHISPDGTQVAYQVWWIDEQENAYRGAIWSAPLDGAAPPRRLTWGERRDTSPRWSPDGRAHIFVADLDGTARQLTDGDCEDGQPAWSPDGRQIAFSSMRGERWDIELRNRIYLVSADGGEPVPLTGTDGSCTGASFSPDGTRIGAGAARRRRAGHRRPRRP